VTEIELHQNTLPIRDLVDGVTKVEVDTHGFGPRVRVTFENGYGASVVRNMYSYGGSEGLWELAVLGLEGGLTYETPVTDDVIGHLDGGEVIEKLREISALTPEAIDRHARAREALEIAEELEALLNRARSAGLSVSEDGGAGDFGLHEAQPGDECGTLLAYVAWNKQTGRWEITP
jgi:hypothetical protein